MDYLQTLFERLACALLDNARCIPGEGDATIKATDRRRMMMRYFMKRKDLTGRQHQTASMTLVSVLKVFVQMPFASLDWKGFQTVILGLGLLAFSVTNAYPTLWYVDPAATGSTHNGTSWSTAWTSFSSIVWGSSGVKAGDTLYLSGGSTSQTYTSTLTIGASGTASSPLTIALDATNSAHNGMVIFDFSALSPKCTANGVVFANRTT